MHNTWLHLHTVANTVSSGGTRRPVGFTATASLPDPRDENCDVTGMLIDCRCRLHLLFPDLMHTSKRRCVAHSKLGGVEIVALQALE